MKQALLEQRLEDQAKQTNQSDQTGNMKKTMCFRMKSFKWGMEPYMTMLQPHLQFPFIKFRLSNHRLPVETGRYENLPYEQRLCQLCNNKSCVGDEYHYLIEYQSFQAVRKKFIPTKHRQYPSYIKYAELMIAPVFLQTSAISCHT